MIFYFILTAIVMFFIGRYSSQSFLKEKDVDWLFKKLESLGYDVSAIKLESQKDNEKNDESPFALEIKRLKTELRSETFEALFDCFNKGFFSFYWTPAIFNQLPINTLKAEMTDIINDFNKEHSGIVEVQNVEIKCDNGVIKMIGKMVVY